MLWRLASGQVRLHWARDLERKRPTKKALFKAFFEASNSAVLVLQGWKLVGGLLSKHEWSRHIRGTA